VVLERQALQREQVAFLKVLTFQAVMPVTLALAAAAPWRRCWPRSGSCPGADLQCCARWVKRGVWSWGRVRCYFGVGRISRPLTRSCVRHTACCVAGWSHLEQISLACFAGCQAANNFWFCWGGGWFGQGCGGKVDECVQSVKRGVVQQAASVVCKCSACTSLLHQAGHSKADC
jgi:hypothetical protein